MDLRDSWNSLLSRMPSHHPPSRHIWLRSWIDSYWTNRPLLFILISYDEKLVAAAPLVIETQRRFGFNLRRLQFASDGTTASNCFLLDPQHPESERLLYREIAKFEREWDVARFENLTCPHNGTVGFLNSMERSGLRAFVSKGRNSPYFAFKGSFADYMATRSSNFRYDAKRCGRRLHKAGRIEIVRFDDKQSISCHLDEAFAVSKASWKGPEKSDMAGTAERERFYRNICTSTDPDCRPMLWILYLEEKPIAIQFYISNQIAIHLLRSDFDLLYEKLRPGVFLQNQVITDCFSMRFREFNFGGMDYPYKMRYTDRTRQYYHFEVFNRGYRSSLVYNLKRIKRWTGQAVVSRFRRFSLPSK